MSGAANIRAGLPHPNPSPEGEGLAINPRGEMALSVAGTSVTLRPSFAALVKAEAELGPLFGLIERAAQGGLTLGEIVGLFWHCIHELPESLTRETLGEAVVEAGIAKATPLLKGLIGQILKGQ